MEGEGPKKWIGSKTQIFFSGEIYVSLGLAPIYSNMRHIKLFENFNEPDQFCEYCLEPVDLKLLSHEDKSDFIKTGLCPKCLAAKNDKKFNSEIGFDDEDNYPEIGKRGNELDSTALNELEGIVERAMNYPLTKEGYFKFWSEFFRWERDNNFYGGTQSFTYLVGGKVVGKGANSSWINKEYSPRTLNSKPRLRIGVKLLSLRQRFKPVWGESSDSSHMRNMNPDISPNTSYEDELNTLETSIKGKGPGIIIHNQSNDDRREFYMDFKRNALRKVGLANREKLKRDLDSGEYFKNLSLRDLDELMNKALDSRDFKTADILRKIIYPE